MTYQDTDSSVSESRPFILIKFSDGFGNSWRYTTRGSNETFLGEVYISDICKVGELELTENAFRNQMIIELSRGNAFAVQFVSAPLESRVDVILYRLVDVDSGGPQYSRYWSGMLIAVVFDKDGIPKLTCEPKTSSIARLGRRRVSQVMCDLAVYGQGTGECNVNKESYKIEGVVDTIVSPIEFESSSFMDEANNWLKGGEFVTGNAHRLILSHLASSGAGSITINRPINDPELDSGGNIVFTAYAGCGHSPSVCTSKFNNKINYGGLQYLPTKNPFIGDPIA